MENSPSQLDQFYADLRGGLSVSDFLCAYTAIFEFVHLHRLTEAYRLAKRPMKALRDEITPASHFIRAHALIDEKVRFPMDGDAADCILSHAAGRTRKIQITVAQAKARRHTMIELNTTGCGRGFVKLTDDDAEDAFAKEMADEHRAYSTEEVKNGISDALKICLRRKKYHSGADILLIDAPLEVLPRARWETLLPQFSMMADKLAASTAFSEIYVVGSGDGGSLCLRLR